MRVRVNHVVAVYALVTVAIAASIARAAEPDFALADHHWVPSFAVTSGVTMQRHIGDGSSLAFAGGTGATTQLRPPRHGDDRAVSPYVGYAAELMTPMIAPRFRLFAAFEFLPTFAPERDIAREGEADRIRGPDVNAVIAAEEDIRHYLSTPCDLQSGFCPRTRNVAFGDDSANGQGARLSTQVDTFVYGAKAGLSWSFEFRGHEMRIKPSLGWLHYKLNAKGYLVDPTCGPSFATANQLATLCTDVYTNNGVDPPTLISNGHGNMREAILSAHDSGVFDGVGPGIELELQTGRIGPVGTAVFLGIAAYYIPGDRDISFSTARSFDDCFSNSNCSNTSTVPGSRGIVDVDSASWQARVAPWVYRGGLGVRFQWLGSSE